MKKILLSIITVIIAGAVVATPVFADNNCVETVFFGTVCDSGDGSSVMTVLRTVVNVMSVGVGILATVGIAISGTQYLTAGDNEEKVRKSKRRIFEIIIGLAAYALIYALLAWLLPGFNGV